MSKFKIRTTDGLSFDIDSGQIEKMDIIENKDGSYQLIYEGNSYTIEVLESNYLNKSYVLNVNEKEIALDLMDELDMKIESMGYAQKSESAGGRIESPMPGLVLETKVQEGDVIKAGEVLLILEAMKMENVIKSPVDGTVTAVHVAQGETVAKKQLLIELS
jgi:biotin carboxyl carrier protein